MAFNGVNSHSVVVLDNCSVHDVDGIISMIEQVGALVHFLLSYSPDYNPTEEAFLKVKTEMKKNIEAAMPDILDTDIIALS